MQIGGYLKSGNYPEISQMKKQILKQRMPVKTGSSSCNKFVDVFLQPRLSGLIVKEGAALDHQVFLYQSPARSIAAPCHSCIMFHPLEDSLTLELRK